MARAPITPPPATSRVMKAPPGAGVASILSPDAEVRKNPFWQFIDRMWRPGGGWALVSGMVYAFVAGPAIDKPMDPLTLGILLTLVIAMWGLKTAEKITGVA